MSGSDDVKGLDHSLGSGFMQKNRGAIGILSYSTAGVCINLAIVKCVARRLMKFRQKKLYMKVALVHDFCWNLVKCIDECAGRYKSAGLPLLEKARPNRMPISRKVLSYVQGAYRCKLLGFR